MNKLPRAKQAAILRALTEGASIRSTARMVGVSKTTVLKLLVEAGEFCETYHNLKVRKLPCRHVQADELWAFCGAKKKNAKHAGQGDAWTFTSVCADTKLVISWQVGHRTAEYALSFMEDTAARLANRVQLTTDGHTMYLTAVEGAFGFWGGDYAMLIKKYGQEAEAGPGTARRYSPPVCTGCDEITVMGNPNAEHISTSYVERTNLNSRLFNRRHTRLTNAFSRKIENHAHAMALHFMVLNFCRTHTTLTKAAKGYHTSPAMAAGLTDHVWKIEEILDLMDPDKLLQ